MRSARLFEPMALEKESVEVSSLDAKRKQTEK